MRDAPRNPRDVYLVHPVVDVLVAGGGLSFIAYFLFRAFHSGERSMVLVSLAGIFSYFINYPHFAATSFRLYQSFDRMMQFPLTAFLSPVVVGFGLTWALIDPSVAPWYCKIFLVWSGYHYSGQTKGITILYARRLGIDIDPWTRRLIEIASYASWLYLIVNAETGATWGEFYALTIPVGLPFIHEKPMPYEATHLAAQLIFLASVGAFGALLVRTALRGRVLPLAACAPLASQLLWYGPGMEQGVRGFAEFIPLFHSMQYLMIAWVFQLKEQSARTGATPSADFVGYETLKWAAGIAIGGFLLFRGLPDALSWTGYEINYAEPCFIAAVQIHHFFVDGVIWKIRDPRTRTMLGGNVIDLAGVPRGELVAA